MNRDECIKLLVDTAQKSSRLPHKADFSTETVFQIKRSLGPWPRALEEAGLKSVSTKRLNKQAAYRRKRRGRRDRLRRRSREQVTASAQLLS